MTQKSENPCHGCCMTNSERLCVYLPSDQQMLLKEKERCPCSTCLVKILCKFRFMNCPTFASYINKFFKQYPIESLYYDEAQNPSRE